MRDVSSTGSGDDNGLLGGGKKLEDLKNALETGKEQHQVDAMKKVIGYIAKGRNASTLFPSIVKLVASSKPELKKLVYVYLERYAEEQQDLALLSISTFQRSLKDHNQLIRGSALRVMSSIRVPIISPILLLGISEAANDMSPYVRKTAAHAIPKLAATDPSTSEPLIEIISRLLGDRAPLVAGSAVLAYLRVCPDRVDLLHKNYRKLCQMLIDVDEWGQLSFLEVLTRYARSQFTDPKKGKVDFDLRLLLTACVPLLLSRNGAVVLKVVLTTLELGNDDDVAKVISPLMHLATADRRETKFLALEVVYRLVCLSPHLISPYLKHFTLFWADSEQVALIKIKILTKLAVGSPGTAHQVNRELETICFWDKPALASEAVRSLGVIATVPELTQSTLSKLLTLINDKREDVSGEAVVSVQKLIQINPQRNQPVIKKLARLYIRESVASSNARSSILWLVGEYAHCIPHVAPDVLRIAAKSFIKENDEVKMHTLTLAAKMSVQNDIPEQVSLATTYIFNLARYDQSYDLRDRARFLKNLIFGDSELSNFARDILTAAKPVPKVAEVSERFRSATMSASLGIEARRYSPLPPFAKEATPSSLREGPKHAMKPDPKHQKNPTKSSSESESESESETEEGTSGPDESDCESESESSSGAESVNHASEEDIPLVSKAVIMAHEPTVESSSNINLTPLQEENNFHVMTPPDVQSEPEIEEVTAELQIQAKSEHTVNEDSEEPILS